jgi:two-component system phosphate regulon sensor histidine kinase PhoR
LFPRDAKPGADQLAVVFPGARSVSETPVVAWAIVSGLFIAVTVACFAVVLRQAAAQRAFAARLTDFVNNLAHEFKTPLSTVTLAGDAIADAAGSGNAEGVAKFRRVIADECRRLRVQVERVLEVAALERRGPAGLNLAPVDLHDVVRVALENFEPRVTARQGRIEVALDAGRHHVIGDEVHLLNVLHNLLDNALKYTAKPPAIRVTTTNAARIVRLAVEDNGIGIPPGQQRRIFEPFYRAPRGGVHDVQGFGIGLSYVARVVAGHGGSIRVRGCPNGGSVFEIELPVRAENSDARATSDDAS